MRKIVLYALCLTMCLAACVDALAQADFPRARLLTIDELLDMGVRNSLRLQASQVGVKISEQAEGAARSARLPDIGINATVGYMGDPRIFMGPGMTNPVTASMPNWLQNYDVSLAEPIYRGGRIKYNIDKTALQTEIARCEVSRDEQDVKLLLVGKYLGLFQLYKGRDVLQQNIKEAQQRLHDIEGMKREGMVTENDVIRSQLELTNYELSMREMNDNIEIVSQQLDIALGLDENLLLAPDTVELSVPRQALSYEEYVGRAYDHFPELQIAQGRTAVAQQDFKIARAAYLPTLSFAAGNRLDRPILDNTPILDYFANSWSVALVLSFPISSLYHNRHAVGISRQAVSIRQLQEEQQKQDIRTAVKAAWVCNREALDRVAALEISVKQAAENYRIVNNKYFNQLAVLTDLLDATAVRLRTEMQLTEAKANVAYTYYQLLRASGDL